MAEETNTASAATQGAIGHIVRIVGPVVDVEFAPDHMPAIYNALTVKATTPVGDINVVLEVQMPGSLRCHVVYRRPGTWSARTGHWCTYEDARRS